MPTKASVIVPVSNGRGRELRALLDALGRQTLPRSEFEVVIGDDGSDDGSTEGLETADGWVRVARGPRRRNSYAARNRAVAAAHASPVLAFCDSDCVPEPSWLEEGIAALAAAEAAAGAIRFTLPERRSIWTLVDIESTKDHERQVRFGNAETANLFVRRELFDRLDGFDDSLPEHGDFDFANRCVAAGARLVYAPRALVWHPAREGAASLLRMMWVMNRWAAARAARAGDVPPAVKLRCWVPVVTVLRGRRRFGYPLGIDRKLLRENGIDASRRSRLAALPIIYLVLPYLRAFAQLRGWWDGRRLRGGHA
jgi:GT2 family glycosyltransferase